MTDKQLHRFLQNIRIDPDGCWRWIGTLNADGYARVWWGGRGKFVHRFSYEHFIGPIPDGHEIDHTCHNPETCVAPCPHRACQNLEATTHKVNVLRGDSYTAHKAQQALCKRGHVLDRIRPDDSRQCSICTNARARAKYAENPEPKRVQNRAWGKRMRAERRANAN
jgi:hypothetical protein